MSEDKLDILIRLVEEQGKGFSRVFEEQSKRLGTIESRLDSIDSRFNSIDKRLNSVDDNIVGMKRGVGNLENRFENLHFTWSMKLASGMVVFSSVGAFLLLKIFERVV